MSSRSLFAPAQADPKRRPPGLSPLHQRRRLSASPVGAVGLGALAVISFSLVGCGNSSLPVGEVTNETQLAALLADGDLSSMPMAMMTPPASQIPARFCPGATGTGGKRQPPQDGGAGGVGGSDMGGPGGAGGFAPGGAGGFAPGGAGGFAPGGAGGFAPGGAGGFDPGGAGGFDPGGAGGFGPGGAGGMSAGGAGGGSGDMGAGGESGDCSLVPLAHWTLRDCSPVQTQLADTAFTSIQHTAFRTLSAACDQGVADQGVRMAGAEDFLYAPDQPDFLFDRGLTIAAWIKPDKLGGVQNIARKRQDTSSSFVLALDGNKLTFALRFTNGRVAGVSTPFKDVGKWSHVAATFNGKEAILYVNGVAAATARVNGVLSNGVGPIFVGNDASGRRLKGVVDEIWLNNLASPPDVVRSLTCIPGTPELALTPTSSPATPAGGTFTFDLSIKNNNTATCQPANFNIFPNLPRGLTLAGALTSGPVASGQTVHVPAPIASDSDLEESALPFTIFLIAPAGGESASARGTFNVAPPSGCRVSKDRELFVRDVSVVAVSLKKKFTADPADPRTGAWTFRRFLERMAPRPEDAPDLAEAIFRSFTTTQTVNGFSVRPRPGFTNLLSSWPRTNDGKLDLGAAPLLLDAVVNRLDLRDLSQGNAGEGRFVFNFLDPQQRLFGLQATLIMEYTLPANSQAEIQGWADAWHALGALPFPSEEYNVALQAITDRITARNALPGRTNGSGILRIRTNEIDFGGGAPWELREFNFDPSSGFMVPAAIKVTPDLSFNGSKLLSDFMDANASDILLDRHSVPETFQGTSFATGAVFNDLRPWVSDGSVNSEVRHHFSLNTCNGCHGGENSIAFLQVFPRSRGVPSTLSQFLTGSTVPDPLTRQPRTFNDLARRRDDLMMFVCPSTPVPAGSADGGVAPTPAKGISRTE